MESDSSREAFVEAEVEREVAFWIEKGAPPERVEFVREELRALLQAHPTVSRFVNRVVPKIVQSSGVAGEDDAVDDSAGEASESGGG